MQLTIPVAPGELLDKLTILEIKAERIEQPDKLANVQRELELLTSVWDQARLENERIAALRTQLRQVNESLWQIEDDIREEERHGRFGERFIELARSVYVTNDRRAAIKKAINVELGSVIVEEKSYRDYRGD
ncbi:MAG: hypothetical protein EA370_02560 [Wenzhouxiangella sp.]|nr:MAG: hypothetical protein EA370_02560 [Wenzhouxiangella sp.]